MAYHLFYKYNPVTFLPVTVPGSDHEIVIMKTEQLEMFGLSVRLVAIKRVQH